MKQRMLDAAKRNTLRILGPNCLGLIIPGRGVNAAFAHLMPKAGGLAFLSQSGAILTSVIDWAQPRGIGFSHLVSMGELVDVDFGDMLDYLADDPQTTAILMYVEAVTACAEVHVRGPARRAHEAGHRHQGRPLQRGRQGGRLAYRRAGRRRRGL